MGSAIRFCCGAAAGLLRLPPWLATALAKGKAPPPFQKAPSIGAAVLGSRFQDISLKSKAKDALQLHAVQDDGSRRMSGKRPIVFVHGFPDLWLSWRPQLEHFAALGHPVLALSMRGYGLSAKPPQMQSYHLFDYLIHDVRAAIAHAVQDGNGMKPLLVAHDWGAGVCWGTVGLSTTEPAEIAGFVSLANPPAEAFQANFSLKQLWASLYIVFFNAPMLPEFILLASNAWFTGLLLNWTEKTRVEDEEMLNVYRTAALQDGAMTAQLNYYRALVQLSPTPATCNVLSPENKLKLPVLIIRGKEDVALLGSLFKDMHRYLANYSIIELDQCSHWIQHDAPDAVNKHLSDFLKKLK